MIYRTCRADDFARLHAIWDEALAAHGIEPSHKTAALFDSILDRYQEKHRCYHNAGHLAELFEYWEQYKNHMKEPYTIALALFYHDAIYDASSQDNELNSAVLARNSLMELGMTDSVCARIFDLIVMTKTHECDISDFDACLMLDMDMAILGTPQKQYDQYRLAVEAEYAGVFSKHQFAQGRMNLYIIPWLQKERFFKTDIFENRFGNQIRINLEHEYKILSDRLRNAPVGPAL